MAAQAEVQPTTLEPGPLRATLRAALTDPTSRAYGYTIRIVVSLIFLSVITIVLETVDTVYRPYEAVIDGVEIVILAAFSAEFLANLYAAEDRRKYLLSFWGIVDLLAILPGYLSLLHIVELKFIRTLRVLRVLRVLKLMKLAASRAQQSSALAIERKNSFALDIQIYFIALFTVVVIASTLGYYAEADVAGTRFTSIPAAMWWAMATITTTGYGDMVPATPWGRLVAAGTMLSGLALFGILTSVIGRAVLTSLFGAAPDGQGPGAGIPPPPGPSGAGAPFVSFAPAGAVLHAAEGEPATGSASAVSAAPSPAAVLPAPVPAFTSPAESPALASVPLEPFPQAYPGASRGSSTAYMRSAVHAREIHHQSHWLYRLIHAAFVDETSRLYRAVSAALIILVFASVGLVIAESAEDLFGRYQTLFHVAEYIIVAAFTLEYAAYFAVAKKKREYVLSFWGIVDLLAILPTYLALLNFTGVKVVRTLRILRVLRILKLSKMAAQRGQESIRRRDNTFWIDLQIYLITLFTAVVLSSTLVYYAERDVPHTAFVHIPISMWWAIVTITTTGYGDMAPVTTAGRLVAGTTMLTGLALFGILTSVIGRFMLASLFGHTGDAE